MSESAYIDTYLTGPPDHVQAVLDQASEDGHAVIPMVVLDAVGQACVRSTVGSEVRVPEGAAFVLDDLMLYPQTAQAIVGGFMPDPPPPPEPEPDPDPEQG